MFLKLLGLHSCHHCSGFIRLWALASSNFNLNFSTHLLSNSPWNLAHLYTTYNEFYCRNLSPIAQQLTEILHIFFTISPQLLPSLPRSFLVRFPSNSACQIHSIYSIDCPKFAQIAPADPSRLDILSLPSQNKFAVTRSNFIQLVHNFLGPFFGLPRASLHSFIQIGTLNPLL